MRTHEKIIDDAKGPTALARKLGIQPGKAKQWKRNDSIPGPYWAGVAATGIATLEELALAAATRPKRAA